MNYLILYGARFSVESSYENVRSVKKSVLSYYLLFYAHFPLFFFNPCFILLSITAFCPLHMIIFFPINKCYCFVFPFFSQYSSYCSTQPNLWEPFLLILIIMGCDISFMSLLAGAHRFVLSLSKFLSNSSFFVCVHIHHQEVLLALYWKLLYYSHPSFKILSFYPIVSIGKFFIIMRMNY